MAPPKGELRRRTCHSPTVPPPVRLPAAAAISISGCSPQTAMLPPAAATGQEPETWSARCASQDNSPPRSPTPPTNARTAPVLASSTTTAPCWMRSVAPCVAMAEVRAASAALCSRGSRVVVSDTSCPSGMAPPSCCMTQSANQEPCERGTAAWPSCCSALFS